MMSGRLQLWDDDAFKARLKDIAKKRGLSVKAVLEAAGLSPRYHLRPHSRMTNHLMALAKVLDVPPAELMGLGRSEAEFDTESVLSKTAKQWGCSIDKVRTILTELAEELTLSFERVVQVVEAVYRRSDSKRWGPQ